MFGAGAPQGTHPTPGQPIAARRLSSHVLSCGGRPDPGQQRLSAHRDCPFPAGWLFSQCLIYPSPWASLRRQWHPTPALLPGKSHGWRSLVGCSPWGREESDTTERLPFHFSLSFIGEGNGNPLQWFLPGESQGRWSLVGCRLWGCTESDTTEAT